MGAVGQQHSSPIAALSSTLLEWLSPADATALAEAIQQIARNEARRAVAEQTGAHRSYAWQTGDPTADPPPDDPAPYIVELPSKPLEVMASCRTAPTSDLTVTMLRSIDQGATYQNMLAVPATVFAGSTFGRGAVFNWELPETREIVPPATVGSVLIMLQPGDMLIPYLTGGTGVKGFSAQCRVERVDEHTRRGRV